MLAEWAREGKRFEAGGLTCRSGFSRDRAPTGRG